MAKTIRFTRKDGEIQYRQYLLRNIEDALSAISDGKYLLSVTKDVESRTPNQNALFHVWVAVFADHAGYESRADCKRDVKRVILGQKEYVNRLTGEIEKEDYETHLMDTKQMSGLMDRFKAWALSEHGCYLPYYGDPGYEEMMSEYYKQ
jgi:hypothetical protein